MKRHIQIKNSYDVWRPSKMRVDIHYWLHKQYDFPSISKLKNFKPLVIEWWLHNIGYWITKPFVRFSTINALNLRFKDVDLMVDILEEVKTNGKEEN